MVSILAVVFLALLATLSVAYITIVQGNMLQSDSHRRIHDARMQAESGLEYARHHLGRMNVGGAPTDEDLEAAIAAVLPGGAGVEVSADGDSTRGFTPTVSVTGGVVELVITGRSGDVTRQISAEFNLVPGSSGVFDYGVATKGHIVMTGNASIEGVNDPSEGTMYAGTMTHDEVFKLTGNCSIDGDLYAPNPDGYASLAGNISIGGASGASVDEHVHIGVPETEFPEVNPAVYEPFATNVLSGSTSGNKTFTNLRIPAGRNPTFSGNITIKGVLFIEQPNTVRFAGNLNLTGVVVTEDAGDGNTDSCQLKFTGNTNIQGVEALPDTGEFAALKLLPGAFLLAPGFRAEFAGNFGTISGAMAADEFKWTGNAGGIVKGSIICYGDNEFKLTGNSHLQFDRSDGNGVPPGFSTPATLTLVAGSYREY